YRRHPRLYRERIRPRPPWFYLFVSLSLVATLAFALTGNTDLAALTFAGWAVATLWFFARRLGNSSLTPRNVGELIVTSVAIPPLSIYWRLKGAARFGPVFP